MSKPQPSVNQASAAAIVTRGALPVIPGERERLKGRILRMLPARGYRWLNPEASGGVCNWAYIRQDLGGRVPAEEFRSLVEELLAEGRLVEVWLREETARKAPHLLALPESVPHLRRPVAVARGRAELLPAGL
jgi:hypothetical protein